MQALAVEATDAHGSLRSVARGFESENAGLRHELNRLETSAKQLGSVEFHGLAHTEAALSSALENWLSLVDRCKRTLVVAVASPVHDDLAVHLSDAAMRGVKVRVPALSRKKKTSWFIGA